MSLKHNVSKSTGRVYAQVTAILPAVKGERLAVENYEREPWPSEETGAAKAEPVYEVEPIDEGHAAQFDDTTPF